jgi:hypothetical protein
MRPSSHHSTGSQSSTFYNIFTSQHHSSLIPSSFLGIRCGLLARLVFLWLAIISTLLTIYFVLFTNMHSMSYHIDKVPDPITVISNLRENEKIAGNPLAFIRKRSNDTQPSAVVDPIAFNDDIMLLENVLKDSKNSTLNDSSPPLSNKASDSSFSLSDPAASSSEDKKGQVSPGDDDILPAFTHIDKPSRYAYVTLIHGIDESFAYRGYLYNCIVMKKSLDTLGSKMDFIAMIGFLYENQLSRNNNKTEIIKQDLALLSYYKIKIFYLSRLHTKASLQSYFLRHSSSSASSSLKTSSKSSSLSLQHFDSLLSKFSTSQKVTFLEMALLKVTPWNFIQYEKVQYLDCDVLPYANMDCLFSLTRNSFNTGTASPVNSGWFVSITNTSDYVHLHDLTVLRYLKKGWDENTGWGMKVPSDLYYRDHSQSRVVKKWEFNGASLDQGLITHYFVLNEGRVQLYDTNTLVIYEKHYQKRVIPLEEGKKKVKTKKGGPGEENEKEKENEEESQNMISRVCSGSSMNKPYKSSMEMFYHFTGRNKPWLQNLEKPKDKGIKLWVSIFNSLQLSVNSTTLQGSLLKPPLGFFHPNK